MKWIKGRQPGSNYDWIKLYNFWQIDGYLIRIKEDIPRHVDTVKGYRHYRFNIILSGSGYLLANTIFSLGRRFAFFRPDLYPHCFKVITPCYMLSFGFVIKDKK